MAFYTFTVQFVLKIFVSFYNNVYFINAAANHF